MVNPLRANFKKEVWKGRMLRPRYSEPHYSLYSSDTEEQIASAHRGLNKCTSLLKSLMIPGDKKAAKKVEFKRRKKSLKNNVMAPLQAVHQNKCTSVENPGGHDGGGGGGGGGHNGGGGVGGGVGGGGVGGGGGGGDNCNSRGGRRERGEGADRPVPPPTQGHKRSVTEPGTSALHRTTLRQLSSTPVQRAPQPQYPVAKKETTPLPTASRRKNNQLPHQCAADEQENQIPCEDVKHVDRAAMPKRSHELPPPQSLPLPPHPLSQHDTPQPSTPPPQLNPPPPPPQLNLPPPPLQYNPPLPQFNSLPPPPQLNPSLQSYPWSFCHLFPYNYTNPLSMQPVLTPMGPYMGTLPVPNVPTSSRGGGSGLMQCLYMPGAPPPLHCGQSWLNQDGGQPVVPGSSIQGNTLDTVRSLLKEMLHSLEGSMATIKATSGCANMELTSRLETAEAMQRAYVEAICTHLSSRESAGMVGGGAPGTVSAEWLLRQEEMEEEKTRLHKCLLKSETAYSETKSKLESARLKSSQQLKDLEWQKSQCSALKLELLQKAEAIKRLSARNEALELELTKAKMSNDCHCTSEEEKQLNSLDAVQKDLSLCKDELTRTRHLLEAAQEDVQMTKMSLSEKNVEHLEAQDRLLEIRQCLAYFLSELKPIDQNHGAAYSVSVDAVHRFRSLVDSGDITGFSAFYRARMASEQHGSNPEKGSSPLSTASSSSTLMSSPPPPPPPPPPFCHVLSVQGRRPCIKDGNLVPMTETSSMLTSVTTSTEQEFRRDLATLDADIARLHIQFKVAQQMT